MSIITTSEKAFEYLTVMVNKHVPESWQQIARKPLNDKLFQICPGASGQGAHAHHSDVGGLMIHTAQVLGFALAFGGVWEKRHSGFQKP